ncbi:Ig-like domain-containing protein [Alicyclobacillus dauci]|uniref:Ig-like domain-containing protein n=1 Tax=Alicyclobacillus dauci TaxID=1475485 RepID=A0ABY6Z1N0_9BACL|nr:Ig-like domain-containing protein [Alicyclobacillus dauci]WAH36803.1 Ig-like domain-containing protein [Alicyclobacillus dauci]
MKRILTGLAATTVVIGTGLPMAFASTSSTNSFKASISISGTTVSTMYGVVANDGSHDTSYLPVYYLNQLFNKAGYKATWNGSTHTWALTTSKTNIDFSKVNVGSGNTSVTVNGKLVKKFNTIVQHDPAAPNISTTFAPIYYVTSLLGAYGWVGNWNGNTHTLSVNPAANQAAIFSAVATNGSITVVFDQPLTSTPAASDFVVTGSVGSSSTSVPVSKVDVSADKKTVTLTISEIPPTAHQPVPHYSVKYLGGATVAAYERVVAVNDGTLGEVAKTVQVGQTVTVAGVSDQCTPMPSITFQSDNPAVATVTADGTVTALTSGVAHIIATDAKGFTSIVPFTLTVQSPNDASIASAVATNGSLTVVFNKPLTATPAASDFVVTGTVGTTDSPVAVSKVTMSTDMTTATLTIPEIPPTAHQPIPHYSVQYLGQPAVTGYERVVAVNDGTPGEVAKTIAVGKTLTVAGVSDQCTPMPSITFQSDNPAVATVTADGTVTAIGTGVAHIVATDSKGFKSIVPFTVTVQ